VAAVHQTGVRHDGADEPFFLLVLSFLGETRGHLRRQALRCSLVKRAGDGAVHLDGEPQIMGPSAEIEVVPGALKIITGKGFKSGK